MAYNEYDDPHFFQEYAKMGRSQGGLPAAGGVASAAAAVSATGGQSRAGPGVWVWVAL